MAKKVKKVSRKELLNKPDEFLTFSGRLFQFALEHKFQLLGALGGIIALVLIISGVRYSLSKKADEAFARLENGQKKYEALLNDNGARQAYEQVREDFQLLLDKYAGQTGGKFARVVFADICYEAGELDKAIALYTAALQDFSEPFYRNTILNGLAYAHEKKTELKQAVAFFEQVAASPDSVLKAEALFNAGRLYAALGETGKSEKRFRQLTDEQPDSLYAALARERAADIPDAAATTSVPP